jgi:putative ABC transport system permease protein
MIKNYLKVAIRNIIKHKGFSAINIVGLAIGIACSVLIWIFMVHELSYDKFHENADRIYRIAVRASIGDTKIRQTFSSSATFKKLLEDFPEIETGVKFLNLSGTPVMLGEKTYYESQFYAVDAPFFDVFTIPLIQGNPKTVLAEPNTMVISKATAFKYFGSTDAVGKILRADFMNHSTRRSGHKPCSFPAATTQMMRVIYPCVSTPQIFLERWDTLKTRGRISLLISPMNIHSWMKTMIVYT